MTDLKLTLMCCQLGGTYIDVSLTSITLVCARRKMIYIQLAPDVLDSQHLMARLQSGV